MEKATEPHNTMEKTPEMWTASTPLGTQFACMSLHMTDRIRVLRFPPRIIEAIKTTIISSWPDGIQKECNYYGSHEFKLNGRPWQGQSKAAVHARQLMCHIFETLFNAGWILGLSTDVSKKQTDKDTLLFRYQDPPPMPCEWMCISFSSIDRLRFIDAPPEVVQAMIKLLAHETQSHKPFHLPNVYELKLKGHPWSADGGATMEVRKLLLKLLEGLEAHGFAVYASIDQKVNYAEHVSETDTWHCCRKVGWSTGAPVYHPQ